VVIIATVITTTTTTIIFIIFSTLFLSSGQITQQVHLQYYVAHQKMISPAKKSIEDFRTHHLNNWPTGK
jgi:hypothetical protein